MAEFSNYTGERPGYFFDPNWGEYFPISSHAGAYRNYETGELSTSGAQPAYVSPSRQQEYEDEVRAAPIVAVVSLASVDLARTSIPGSPQTVASQPSAVGTSLSTIPTGGGDSRTVTPAGTNLYASNFKLGYLPVYGLIAYGLWRLLKG